MEQIRVTEQASAYDDLQRMSVHDLLTGINREDRRVADAVAARSLYGAPVIVVDFGTATNMEVIDRTADECSTSVRARRAVWP